MTDDELIARLDTLYSMLESEGYYVKANTASFAKDRIEAQATEIARLVKERDAAVHLARMRKAFIEEARDERDAFEAKLAKAVEALEAFKEFDDLPTAVKRPDLFEIKVRRPILRALAELEGDKT